jgi:hypothetical protein
VTIDQTPTDRPLKTLTGVPFLYASFIYHKNIEFSISKKNPKKTPKNPKQKNYPPPK